MKAAMIFLVTLFCVPPQNIDAPAVVASYCQATITDGHLRIFLPGDAVDPAVGQFFLRARIVGEKDCRPEPIFLRVVSGGHEFSTTERLSISNEGKILFDEKVVEAFDVFKTP